MRITPLPKVISDYFSSFQGEMELWIHQALTTKHEFTSIGATNNYKNKPWRVYEHQVNNEKNLCAGLTIKLPCLLKTTSELQCIIGSRCWKTLKLSRTDTSWRHGPCVWKSISPKEESMWCSREGEHSTPREPIWS